MINNSFFSKTFIICLFISFYCLGQEQDIAFDPNFINENLPKSPEASNLGTYGDISNNPYNGKANINVPIHTINFDGLQIPINLNYDSGGVRVQSEASWIGLNWSLSTHVGITRTINGSDDLNENVIPNSNGDISAFVFNPIEVQYNPGSSPYVLPNDQVTVHESYGDSPHHFYSPRLYADLQPDIYEVSIFGKDYKFRFEKRQGTNNILQTHIFNNSQATITYNLNQQKFTLVDDKGFSFYFSTLDYSTPFSSTRSSSQSAANNAFAKDAILGEIKSDLFGQDNTIITSWLLDKIVSPKGRELDFTYKKSAYFSQPSYGARTTFRDGAEVHTYNHDFAYTFSNPPNQTSTYGMNAVKFSATVNIFENNYLEKIEGDFGSVEFVSDDRKDLMTGNDFKNAYSPINNAFNTFTFFTGDLTNSTRTYRQNHGTNDHDLKAAKLNAIIIKDYNNTIIENVILQNSYFNDHKINASDKSLWLRLKLDQVIIGDKEYSFTYEQTNNLPKKDSDAMDFWGFYNGVHTNSTSIPSLGRFAKSYLPQFPGNPEELHTGSTYFNFEGDNKSANFNYGKIGLLTKVEYPTGGYSLLIYEPHDAVIDVTQPYVVTERFPVNNRIKNTSLENEDLYNFTYLYLKNSADPTFNFYDHEFQPGNSGTEISANFTVTAPTLVRVQADLRTEQGAECLPEWSGLPRFIIENTLDTSIQYPIFYYDDFSEVLLETINLTRQVIVPPGMYRIKDIQPLPPNGACTPGLSIQNRVYTKFEASGNEVFAERFEIGGARVYSITHFGNNQEFISKKQYDYSLPDVNDPTIASSGKLMNDIIFHSKSYGYYSYDPRVNPSEFNISSTSSLRGLPSAQGNHIGYTTVKETDLDNNNTVLSTVERTYHNRANIYAKESFTRYRHGNVNANGYDWVTVKNTLLTGLSPRTSYNNINGNVLSERIYDDQGALLQLTENMYDIFSINSDTTYFAGFMAYPHSGNLNDPYFENNETYHTYRFNNNYAKTALLRASFTTEYLPNGGQMFSEQYQEYIPETGDLLITESIISDTESRSIKYYYPYSQSVSSLSGMSMLLNDNQYSKVVRTESYINADKIATRDFDFNTLSGNVVPIKQNTKKGSETEKHVRELYEKYDDRGNLLQKRQKNGQPITYIWGYNKQYIVAKVVNATYSQIENLSAFGQNFNIQNGLSSNQENQLRNIANTLVTTYNYNPMIGVTKVSDPRGDFQTFEYDSENRLIAVRDQNNNLLKEYEYNINPDIISGVPQNTTPIISLPQEPDTVRITRSSITDSTNQYNALFASVELTSTMAAANVITHSYKVFAEGGTDNLEYRWKIKGGEFTPYQSSPTWSIDFDCSAQDVRGVIVICEVRDTQLEITKREKIRHVVLCNN
ncbi:hypothetical protein GCM10011344_27250 [Dokdonia pacifica]|uniref:YD repeat-containing protein n=1 Tax=Dokdonia pacifica TaxID=1627892 RepID=A0A239E7N5_9FLAO|nr:hypothetical protein [Dokdonia pacifica]GGG25126.1 hypothetical protein GCM10011344_27250 [Dokdonia pacifica]SNS40013.1 YD repeat-containing protein [Dokdonia pacifica]